MNRTDIDKLIVQVMAIRAYAKDIHYNCVGKEFYGDHLFADRFVDNMDDYIDQLKEICLLGHGLKTLHSDVYMRQAAAIIPAGADFKSMRLLMLHTLEHIETIQDISRGDENLIGAIAQDIQNNVGLINVMLGDLEGINEGVGSYNLPASKTGEKDV